MSASPRLTGKRKVTISKTPNPLFEHWIKEWKDDAASKGLKTQYVYSKALASLKKYPLTLEAKECRLLENFGEKTCKMLEDKLTQYIAEYGTSEVVPGYLPNVAGPKGKRGKNNTDSSLETLQFNNLRVPAPPQMDVDVMDVDQQNVQHQQPNRQRRRSEREYIPQQRSGAYAILLTLFNHNNGRGHLSKRDLMHEAQSLADKSFTVPDPGSRYTAWSSMGTLIKKALVVKESNPAKYRLTAAGEALAARILDGERNGNLANRARNDDALRFRIDDDDEDVRNGAVNFHNHDIEMLADDVVMAVQSSRSSLSSATQSTSKSKASAGSKAKKSTSTSISSSTESVSSRLTVNTKSEIPPTRVLPKIGNEGCATSKFVSTSHTLTRGISIDYSQSSTLSNVPSLSDNNSQSQTSASQISVADLSPHSVLISGLFEVILCVDNSEVFGNASDKTRQVLVKELERHNVPHVVRPLNIGDFCWIARDKCTRKTELVLDYIVERKRMDDLAGSIIDGRFKEQKFRLKNCGINHPIYLVEEYGSAQHFSIGEDALNQAITNTQITDGFSVKRTGGTKESAAYLTLMTRYIQSVYINKTLNGVGKSQLEDLGKSLNDHAEAYLMSFDEFNKSSVKSKTLTVKEMFGKQLCQLRGMTGEKAVSILNTYPTVTKLVRAYMTCPINSEKEKLLANIKFGPLHKNIGAALSKSVYYLYNTKGKERQ